VLSTLFPFAGILGRRHLSRQGENAAGICGLRGACYWRRCRRRHAAGTAVGNMGMPLYGAQPPTGYSMKAETWVSSSALLEPHEFRPGADRGKVERRKGRHGAARGRTACAGRSQPLTLSTPGNQIASRETCRAQTHDSIMAQITAAQITAGQIQAPPIQPRRKMRNEFRIRSLRSASRPMRLVRRMRV
jgi:hypothetical protein